MTDTTQTTDDSTAIDIDWSDLTAFQRDTVQTIAELEATGTDRAGVYGLAIKDALEERRDEEVNHGQLYPNLDELVEAGLVEKDELDKRTNSYSLSEAGETLLQWAASDLAAAAGFRLHEDQEDREVIEADE